MSAGLPQPPAIPDELPALPREDLVGLFRRRAQDVDTVVHGPMNRAGVPKVVTGIAAGHSCRMFMSWDDLPAPGITSALETGGVARVDHQVPEAARKRHQASYESVDLGVTGAVAGLAESGTVVLSHGAGKPRMASLIPNVHVALLHATSLVRSLADVARRHPEWVAETANLVFVTGPSRTGDIELHLNLGVHGPRHVHVVLIQ